MYDLPFRYIWLHTQTPGYLFPNVFAAGGHNELTLWGQATHIFVSKLTIIGSDNGSSPGRRQAFIWTNAVILLIWLLGRNIIQWNINRNPYIRIQQKAFENVVCEMAAILRRPQFVNFTFTEWRYILAIVCLCIQLPRGRMCHFTPFCFGHQVGTKSINCLQWTA